MVGYFVEAKEGFKSLGTLVVTFLEDRRHTALFELVVYGGVCSDQLRLGAGFHGDGHDCVGILDKGDHDVFVASAGGDGEAAGLVGGDVAGNLHALQIY